MGELYQRVEAADERYELKALDLLGSEDSEAALLGFVEEEASAPFDLESGPLIRARLLCLGTEDHALLITMHHIVSDGWSSAILSRELMSFYDGFKRGESVSPEALPIQYADYAAWQRQWLSDAVLAEHGEYWKKALAGAPAAISLPLDRERPAQQDYSGASVAFGLDEQLTEGLKALSQRHGATLFMTVLAAWSIVLSRLASQEDLVIGVPSANRGRLEIEGLIGFFINTFALRVDLTGAPTVGELLRRVKGVVLGAQAHQDLPFEQVVELVKPVRSLRHSPVFQVMLAWQNNESPRIDLAELEVSGIPIASTPAKFDLTLELGEVKGHIRGSFTYARALFDRSTVERWGSYLLDVLRHMVADEGQVAGAISFLPVAERQKLLVEWNATEAEYPQDRCIHELFEAQVERSPDATAVVYEDSTVSYRELNERANRLAHHLVKPGGEA